MLGRQRGRIRIFRNYIDFPRRSPDTAIMAPGFDQLSDHDFEDDIDDIDFSDLKERYDVRMEEGLDTFVVRALSGKSLELLLKQLGH